MHQFLLNSFKSFFFNPSTSYDIKIFSSLIVFLPIALITGPALPDIMLSTVAIYFLVISILKKQWSYYQNPIVQVFLIFCIYSVLRSIFSEFPFESLFNSGSVFYFRYIFFAMGVWYLIDKNHYVINLLFIISFLCLLVVCIDGIYQYFVGFNILGFPKHSADRLTGFFYDEPKIGRYLAYIFMLFFALSFQMFEKNKIFYLLFIFLISLTGLTIFLSGERAAVFVYTFFLLLTCFFKNRYRTKVILSFIFLFVFILISISIDPIAKKRVIDRSLAQISNTEIGFLPYSKGYEYHFKAALKLFIDHPLFGIGPDNYDLQCDKTEYDFKSKCISHPHNYYFQILSELGVVGFLFLLSSFLSLLFMLTKQSFVQFDKINGKQLSSNLTIFTIIMFVSIWPLIPHLSLYNNWQNVMIMLSLGFFMKYLFGDRSDRIIK